MEPANIDWKNIESRFVRDELYEHINAPKWLDLSIPDSFSSGDDDAWFCRPDCRHPRTADDFLIKSSASPKLKPKKPSPLVMPLGERRGNYSQSLKKRGAIMSLLMDPSPPSREPAKNGKTNGKKFREDAENQNPNLLVNSTTTAATKAVNLKEAMKSSAEKQKAAVNEGQKESKKPAPRLKSTLSARNLFSGRDILGQISEFCSEIKKLAVGKEKNLAAKDESKEEKKALIDDKPKGDDESVKIEKSPVLKEVRACPPTPQRFPSPSSRRLRTTKPATGSSPLSSKPLKSASSKGILQERALPEKDEECSNRISSASASAGESEGSSVDMFWFFKPCTYLAK